MKSFFGRCLIVAAAGAVLVVSRAAAQVPAPAEVNVQEGVVVSAGMGKLVISDAAGKQHTHPIDETTKITVHGKPGKLEDLTLGMHIRVMLDEKMKAVAVATVDEVKNDDPQRHLASTSRPRVAEELPR